MKVSPLPGRLHAAWNGLALMPAAQVSQAMSTVRWWARQHGGRFRCATAVLAVVALAVLQSALIWHAMAGERIHLSEPSRALTAHTRHRSHEHHSLSRDVRSSTAVATSPPTRPAPTTTAPAATMSGTSLAVALITLTMALALLAARVVLNRRPHWQEPAGCQIGGQDPESIDSTSEDPPQAIPLPSPQTSASDTVEDFTLTDGPEHADDPIGLDPEPRNDTGTPDKTSLEQRPTSPAIADHQTHTPPTVLFDRRLTQRVPIETKARLQWDDHDVAGTTVDLGMNGVRCRLPSGPTPSAAPDVGTTVQVTLILNGTLGVFQARVQWAHVDNHTPVMGLTFLRLQAPQQALLQSVILL